ncbi:NU6M oxidoreductase, partial [Oenanthe oenanthe]|nr:NU6M oxidoreductase [Oenanthe oenanthe]
YEKFCLFLGACFILGELAVVSNPSYYYGVVGLVLAGCGLLMSPGTSSELLLLFLVCLGRILVGFASLWQCSPFQKHGGI